MEGCTNGDARERRSAYANAPADKYEIGGEDVVWQICRGFCLSKVSFSTVIFPSQKGRVKSWVERHRENLV